MKTRIIAMLLVICMLMLALASCGGGSGEQKEGNESQLTTEASPVDKWEGVNFDGETIIVSLSTHLPSAATKVGAPDSIKYIAGPDAYASKQP